MELLLLRVHQKQITHQCYAALSAVQQANASLAAQNWENFWAAIQNFLTAVANISKAGWGPGGKLATERRPLRESLGIADNSALANTDLRNHLEHYDERLDRWYKNSANKNYVDFVVGPHSAILGFEDTDIFRFFDPEAKEVIFWGEHYAMQPLVDEIARLLPIAQAESSKPHWDSAGNKKAPTDSAPSSPAS